MIILINYSVGITINARRKVCSAFTADKCEMCLSARGTLIVGLNKFGFNNYLPLYTLVGAPVDRSTLALIRRCILAQSRYK